jgi:hypothetical protein
MDRGLTIHETITVGDILWDSSLQDHIPTQLNKDNILIMFL